MQSASELAVGAKAHVFATHVVDVALVHVQTLPFES